MLDCQPSRLPSAGTIPVRLAKFMADRALCSRREAERLIAVGSVHVNGRVIAQPGVKVGSQSRIEIGRVGECWLRRILDNFVAFRWRKVFSAQRLGWCRRHC